MDEKVLIRSEVDKKRMSIMYGIVSAFFAAGAILFLLLFILEDDYTYYYSFDYGYGYSSSGSINSTRSAFDAAIQGEEGYLVMLIISGFFILLGIIGFVFAFAHTRCKLEITENNVKGKSLFGKQVVLPMYMVSAYSTRKFLSTIAVATSSGLTKFALIKNYEEIGAVLSQKINERQEQTTTTKTNTQAKSNSLDDLAKIKELLDMGVITQEEFDAKKKEILGL